MNVFAVSNTLRIKPMEIFSGCISFFCVNVVAVLIVGTFPQIVELIPRLMGLP